jgi:hypothetical protein
MMGLVFDPGFEENRYIFTAGSHTVQGSIINQLVRYRYTGTGIEDRQDIIDNISGNTYNCPNAKRYTGNTPEKRSEELVTRDPLKISTVYSKAVDRGIPFLIPLKFVSLQD